MLKVLSLLSSLVMAKPEKEENSHKINKNAKKGVDSAMVQDPRVKKNNTSSETEDDPHKYDVDSYMLKDPRITQNTDDNQNLSNRHRNPGANSPIFRAIYDNDRKSFDEILQNSANSPRARKYNKLLIIWNPLNKYGRNPLQAAIVMKNEQNRDTYFIDALIKARIGLSSRDHQGYDALMIAVKSQDFESFSKILSSLKDQKANLANLFNQKNKAGHNLRQLAALYNQKQPFLEILKNNTQAKNIDFDMQKNSLLHILAFSTDDEFISDADDLLDVKSMINQRNIKGVTPIFYAVVDKNKMLLGRRNALNTFVRTNFDETVRSNNRKTPIEDYKTIFGLDNASDNSAKIRSIMAMKPNLEIVDTLGNNILHWVYKYGLPKYVPIIFGPNYKNNAIYKKLLAQKNKAGITPNGNRTKKDETQKQGAGIFIKNTNTLGNVTKNSNSKKPEGSDNKNNSKKKAKDKKLPK